MINKIPAKSQISKTVDTRHAVNKYSLCHFETFFTYAQETSLILDRNPLLGYHKVTSSNTSGLETQGYFFSLLIKGIFEPFVL